VATEITQEGGTALAMACDIGDETNVTETIKHIIGQFGRLDAVFANAGVLGNFKPLAEATFENFVLFIATNSRGTFLLVKHFLSALQGGAVLINAS
jgi:NAD(P)-dependent dehydrogenase (short-subunit alcohol dehydrogenase family)